MKKFECVMQDGPKDCGVCSLLTIVKSHGGQVSKEYLRDLTGTTSNGVNALGLLEAGRKLGFYTQGVKGDVLKIEDKYIPCIAHVVIDNKYKHFVVIHKIDRKNNYVTVADPARGIIKIDVDRFRLISTETFLFFIPNKVMPIMQDNNLIKNKIENFIYDNKKTVIVILSLSLLYILISIIISFNFQFLIERAISYSSYNNLYSLFYIFLLLYSLKVVLDFSREKILYFISHKLDFILINDSLNHILSLPHIYFKNRSTGEILSRISDLNEIKETLSTFIATLFVDLLITIVSVVALLSISLKLSLITLLILLIYLILSTLYNRYLNRDVRLIKEGNAKVNSNIIELINGANTIKSLNVFSKVKEDFSLLYNSYLNTSYNLATKLTIKKAFDNLISSIISIIVLIIGGKLVINNQLSLASLITFNSIIFYNISSIKNLLNIDIIYNKTKVIISRINDLLNIKEEKLYYDINPLKIIHGDIVIKNLTYKYNDNYVLRNVNAVIKEGSKILITGESGCGKSTFAKLISGFIEVRRNKIYIGKYDINDINLWNLREQITYVSQDEYLFNDSLLDNINIKKTRDKNRVMDIAKCMMLDDITNKNKAGYNMLLEENASNLSGGERQRIILARTFLKNSSIYILDETFSEINIEKERIILKNIFDKFKDKTIIVISHRLDNNDLYDEVHNMEEYESRNISREF